VTKLAVEHPTVKTMSDVERSEAQMRVAIKDINHLKRWAVESGRQWLIFNTNELIDSFPKEPEAQKAAIELFMQFVAGYRDHRATIPSTDGGEIEQKEPGTGKIIKTPKTKPETLEWNEIEDCIDHLVSQKMALEFARHQK
jgi:hypothetical protein